MQRECPTAGVITHPRNPVLSLILCSRNDQYMGNSRWRLETALNYVARNVQELGREADVEVLVADWGSEIPLRDVLQLSPAAARIVSFLLIPPEIACPLQGDSAFPEVLALNAAARRVRGDYIGRIDQDTLVGGRFLDSFFELYEGRRQLEIPLRSALLFANRRQIPYRFAVRCPSFGMVERFVIWFGRWLQVDNHLKHRPGFFYASYVGMWLLHRDLWNECRGYDERLIYMNWMETDMILRMKQEYTVVDLGQLVGHDFYHLEHYHPRAPKRATGHRKVNPHMDLDNPANVFRLNSETWGLLQHPLDVVPYARRSDIQTPSLDGPLLEFPAFVLSLLIIGTQIIWDGSIKLSIRLFSLFSTWRRRAGIAWKTVRGEPVMRWPRLLIRLWTERKSTQVV